MRNNRILALAGAVALLASFAGVAGAQIPIHRTTTRMGGMHGSFGQPRMGAGMIIGNKKTKVYHLPGDHGNMPSAKNQVVFRSESEAIRAGYHLAGKKQSKMPMMHPMHGGMMHTAPGGHMNGGLPK